MSFGGDKEAQAWLLHQAGYLDREGYERAAEAPSAPRPLRQPPARSRRQQSPLLAFAKGWKKGQRRR